MTTTPQLNIRVPAELKEAFIAKAKENGTTATDLIVGFMEQYLGIDSNTVAVVDSTAIQLQIQELETRLSERIAALEEQQRGKQVA